MEIESDEENDSEGLVVTRTLIQRACGHDSPNRDVMFGKETAVRLLSIRLTEEEHERVRETGGGERE